MDPKDLTKALEESLQKQLPEVVGTVVDAKLTETNKEIASIKENQAEFNKVMKEFNTVNDIDSKQAKQEAIKATGAFFKELKKSGFNNMDQSIKTAFLNETTDSEGGMMVPTELAREVIRVAGQFGIARKFCRVFPMGTDSKDLTTIISGVTVYWTSEGTAYIPSKPGMAKPTLYAKKLTALVGAANELIEDNQTDQEIFDLVASLIGEGMATADSSFISCWSSFAECKETV